MIVTTSDGFVNSSLFFRMNISNHSTGHVVFDCARYATGNVFAVQGTGTRPLERIPGFLNAAP